MYTNTKFYVALEFYAGRSLSAFHSKARSSRAVESMGWWLNRQLEPAEQSRVK